MNSKPLMPARIFIAFGDRQFHIFPDEITTFLNACDDIGLHSVADIVNDLDEISGIIINSDCANVPRLKRYLKLLRILSVSTQAVIYEQSQVVEVSH